MAGQYKPVECFLYTCFADLEVINGCLILQFKHLDSPDIPELVELIDILALEKTSCQWVKIDM